MTVAQFIKGILPLMNGFSYQHSSLVSESLIQLLSVIGLIKPMMAAHNRADP